jgi:hypothetical protein
MKRKFKDGIEKLNELIKKYTLSDFLTPLVYTHRAYGYFCIGKHQKCLNDLLKVEKLDYSSLYNKYICEGILACSSN